MKYRKPPPPAKMRHRSRTRPRRADSNVGSAYNKYCVHYRCNAKTRTDKRASRKRKRACDTRITMRMPVDWYDEPGQVPKCPSCGSREWRRDKFRDHREYRVCGCNGFPYPHKLHSYSIDKGGKGLDYLCLHTPQAKITAILDRIDPVPF